MRKYLSFIFTLFIIMALATTSCKGPQLSTANEQFERGEYFEAQKTYRKLYNSYQKKNQRDLKAFTAFRSGQCYAALNQTTRAVNAFQNAIRYGVQDSTVYLLLAQGLQRQGKYRDAEKYYEEYLGFDPKSELAKSGLKSVKAAIAGTAQTRYVVKEAKFINGRRSDFSPMFVPKEYDKIYFTTTSEQNVGSTKSGITGIKNGDIWSISKNEQGKWKTVQPEEGELNTEFDEGVISFSPDGTMMYLTRAVRSNQHDSNVQIWTSRRSDAQWSAPVLFEIDNDSIHNYGHPAVSPDGTYLYFTSDRPGGYGGYDIWRMNLNDRGGHIENLGPEINSAGNEFFPYMRNDTTLYFSSDGHKGFGGLDIYKAEMTLWYGWNVSNMGKPVNSSYDDFGIVFAEGESGYLSSNRGDERGYDHIYTFELPDLNVSVSGYVMDPEEYIIPNAYVRIIGDDGSNRRERIRDDGSFRFNLERGVNYVLQASAEGFLNANQHFTSDSEETDAEYFVDFTLAPVNKPIIVDNIFYDYNQATLRPESKTALDSLVKILNDYPNIAIELSSHTDRIGSDRFNQGLSERRAASVVNYLVEQGKINPKRLTSTGYGKSRPMTVTPRLAKLYPEFEEGTLLTPEFIESLEEESQRDDADQINRRTEFKITSTDFYLF